jgi:hypothetical protein
VKQEDAVLVGTYPDRIAAELASSWLESAGIDFVLLADDAGGAYPFLQTTRGVKLLVAAADESRAREALATAAAELPPRDEEPPAES